MVSPKIDAEPLRTILKLERKRNYANTAVFGGIDRYLNNWAEETRIKIASSPPLLARFYELQLDKPSYATWDTGKRKAWVTDILNWLAQPEEIACTPPKMAAQPHTPTVSHTTIARKTTTHPSEKGLDSPTTAVKGVAASIAGKLERLGGKTIRDLLYLFPRRHIDYSQRKTIDQLEIGQEQTALVTVWESRITRLGYQQGTEIIVGDETGNMRVVWFNQPYLAKRFRTNTQLVLSGRVSEFRYAKQFENPEWEIIEDKELIHTGRLVPVYPLTQGLYPRQMRTIMRRVVDEWAWQIPDFLPQDTRNRHQLLELPEAITQAHFPDNYLKKAEARKRLAFDELFLLQLGVLSKKRDWQESQPGNSLSVNEATVNKFLQSMPFSLTSAQQSVLQEILSDIKLFKPMARLLQGDVGSGKTVVATAALMVAFDNGYQGALMAPTEILAEQHFRSIGSLLSKISQTTEEQGNTCRYQGFFAKPLTFALLTGSLNEKEKDNLRQQIQEGAIDITVGTHALIQKGVEFQKLGLAVIDEQHRFGVLQRSSLRQKGFNPHMLVMTATPIPRTMALTLYGDLDLSVIDEMPPGRQKIVTRWVEPEKRGQAYDFLHQRIAEGEQAFVICPLIEESESVEARAAVAEYEHLSRDVFPDLRLGLLHGKMPANEKERTMRNFRDGKLDILVSTSVVEVGIDVPNATVMLVEAADRFGLSQLHQFRGRVGRGQKKSYCLLLSENPSPEGIERLRAIETIHDGFRLAEKDLELRGPGEFFGTRQSGLPDLRMARLSDTPLLELARAEAITLFHSDSDLSKPEHQPLAKE
ncbi:MAG: ATP-dependent DNA helicase RecG, partial [Chloroflexi bacterium]|nr:ATP-dependent DNA helicase RecG [Chloroflexota bacterium]